MGPGRCPSPAVWRYREKLFLTRMDNPAAVAYANYGAGRSPRVTRLAPGVKARELPCEATAAALHIPGNDNQIAGALPRYLFSANSGDLCPGRELRSCLRAQVEAACGEMDVDMTAADNESDAWDPAYRSPAKSSLRARFRAADCGGPPQTVTVELALDRLRHAVAEGWRGEALSPCPGATVESLVPKVPVNQFRDPVPEGGCPFCASPGPFTPSVCPQGPAPRREALAQSP